MRTPLFLPLICASIALAQNPSGGIVTILPANGATGVPLNARITIALAYPATWLTNNPVAFTTGGVAVPGTLQTPQNQTSVLAPPGAFGWYVFTPTNPLQPLTTYSVTVAFPDYPTAVTTFTTGTSADTTPLQLVSSVPAPGQNDVNTTAAITLRFNKPLSPYSFSQTPFDILDLTSGSVLGYVEGANSAPQIEAAGSTLSWTPGYDSAGLPLAHAFQIEFPQSQLTDWLGNALTPTAPIPFTTLPRPETAGPVLQGTAPMNGDTGVPINSSIVLVFDKPLAGLPFNAGVTVTAEAPITLKLDNTVGGGRALIIEPSALLPANTQINVSVTGLVDEFGAPQSAPITFGFTTGATAETRPLQIATYPPELLPQNAAITATFNRAIDPIMLALGGVEVSPSGASNNAAPVPYTLSADHLTVTISAGAPLPAGVYSTTISVPFDRETGKLNPFGIPFGINFTVTGNVDTTPPQVTAVNPPDGTSGAPASSLIQVAFSKSVTLPAGASGFQLLQGGMPVAGTFTLSGSQGAFTPASSLAASSQFQIRISGFTDSSGNVMPDFSSSFSTAASTPSLPPFRITSVSPAQNATGVAPTAPIVLTFNRPVDPVSLRNPNTPGLISTNETNTATNSLTFVEVPGVFQASGSTATFTPSEALPPGTYFVQPGGLTDLSGGALAQFSSSFQVTTNPARAGGPSVVSVWPGNGQTVQYQSPYVVFTFSEPISPTSVNSADFAAYTGGSAVPVMLSQPSGLNQVAVQFSAASGSLVTLYVNPGVTDLSGNLLTAPFQTTVKMGKAPVTQGAHVVTQRPNLYTSGNVPPNTSISLIFSARVNAESVAQGLIVTANGAPVSGKLAWSRDATALTFTPTAAFPWSAAIDLVITYPARDDAGNLVITYNSADYGDVFTIASQPAPPPSSLSVTRTSASFFAIAAPLDIVVDVEFSAAVPAAFASPTTGTIVPINPEGGAPDGLAIACGATLIGTNVIRFRPVSLLSPNTYYTFAFDSGTGVKTSASIQTGTALTPPEPTIVGAGPPGAPSPAHPAARRPALTSGTVPVNTRITVAFTNSVSELAMPTGLTLQTGGVDVPATYVWSSSDRAVTLTPLAFLLSDTDYTVTVTGFADYAGHSIPPLTWTFRTSGSVDLGVPTILQMRPTGNSVNVNAPISVTFSKPVAADWIGRFSVVDSGDAGAATAVGMPAAPGVVIPGSIQFSADQRTLYFNPSQPFAEGHTISTSVPQVDDFAGNMQMIQTYSYTVSSFVTGFRAPSAPSVLASTPGNGSTGLPVNVQIQVQFDQPVAASSLTGVSLVANGSSVTVSAQLEPDGRTVTVAPEDLPSAGTIYTLTVSGVTNTGGAAMAGAFQSTFTVGSTLDDTPPVLISAPWAGQAEVPLNVTIRLRSNKPLNPLSVNSSSVVLTRSAYGIPINANVSLQNVSLQNVSLQNNAQTILVTPALPLSMDTTYTVTVNGVTDLSGNAAATIFEFTSTDGTPAPSVTLLAIDPQNGSINVPPGVRVQALFSQPVDPTLDAGSLVLSGPAGAVAGTFVTTGTMLSFVPNRALADGVYQAQLSGIADVAGHALPAVSTSFTVSAAGAAAAGALTLVSSSPANGAGGVPVSSSITLTFNQPVSAVSAAQINVTSNSESIPGSIVTNGTTVTFTPAANLPGAAAIQVDTSVQDLYGGTAYVYLQFTTGANPDTTPAVLTYSYPANGATVPNSLPGIVLRFSKPVVPTPGTNPIQVFSGATELGSVEFEAGEDGETFSAAFNPGGASQVTVSVTSDLRDFAGIPVQPFSIHFTVEPASQSQGPTVQSVSPADGAVSVALDMPFQIVFAQPMNAASVQAAFDATAAGVFAPTSMTADSLAGTFTFQPVGSWPAGVSVETFLSSIAFDQTGAEIAPQHWQFTTAGDTNSAARPVAFSASARTIDVRFAGAFRDSEHFAYLYSDGAKIPARMEVSAPDQIRVTPDSVLVPAATYHLVLDADHEIVFQIEPPSPAQPEITSVAADNRGIHVSFSRAVNPLTLRRKTRLAAPDGQSIDFTTLTGIDSKEVTIVPGAKSWSLLTLEGLESRDGMTVAPVSFRLTR